MRAILQTKTVLGRTPNTVFLCVNILEIRGHKMLSATHQSTNTALIAFGSNQGDSMQVFKASIEAIRQIAGVSVVAYSRPIWTAPVTGGSIDPSSLESPLVGDSPDDDLPYLNAVIRIETTLSPSDLHLQTSAIEHQFGRVRSGRWQARTIDLDVLLLGDHVTNTRSLTLPHPRMSFRRFVLEPAAEIAAELTHPIAKCSVAELLTRINSPCKSMALVCPEAELQLKTLDSLARELSRISPQWKFIKVFSVEKFFQFEPDLTMVALFDYQPSGDGDVLWRELKEHALRFAGPSLRLENSPAARGSLKELVAALQTIG